MATVTTVNPRLRYKTEHLLHIEAKTPDHTITMPPRQISQLEAMTYYAGLSADGQGPKLIYRTSSDEFVQPTGPEAYPRLMRLVCVGEDCQFSKNGLWDTVCDQTVELLQGRDIKFSSVDLVRFAWPNKGTHYITPPTVWIGVLPNTLNTELAHDITLMIFKILKHYDISEIDIAFRESIASLSDGRTLTQPNRNYFSSILAPFIDGFSTSLSLPIAGLHMETEGTLGFCCGNEDDLYAVTSRHFLFVDDDNKEYVYNAAQPMRHVIFMPPSTFDSYITSMQDTVTNLNQSLRTNEQIITSCLLEREKAASAENVSENERRLSIAENKVSQTQLEILQLQEFLDTVKMFWAHPEDRIIGYVHWAPPVSNPNNDFPIDFCVIKLDKEKFKNLTGNVVNLGIKITPTEFEDLIPDFKYPHHDGLLPTFYQKLTVGDIEAIGSSGQAYYVIKHGSRTQTTVGLLSGFKSAICNYNFLPPATSKVVAIFPHPRCTGAFSWFGDSGSVIVNPQGSFVALLQGGTSFQNTTHNITYAIPMETIWALIENHYQGANLRF